MGSAAIDTPANAAARCLAGLHRVSHIVVAISGGSDSTGLLIALGEQIHAGPYSHRLSAVTIDHGLRLEAAAEARFVAALCKSLAIEHRTLRWEGAKPKAGLMAAAREARYGLLANAATDLGADLIVTGHTWDDQQETLTMRAARAPDDGVEAATGIAEAVLFDRRIWVVRPFLACRRADIRAFLVARGISWIDDPSNVDDHYERVRIRSRLAEGEGAVLPIGGSAVRRTLADEAARWLGEAMTIHSDVLCRIDRRHLDLEAPAVNYALAQLTAVLGGQPFGPGREKLQRIVAFLREGIAGRRTGGGVVFDLRRDGLYLMRESRNIAELHLDAGARGVWDGRFDIVNNSSRAVTVVAAGASSSRVFPQGTPAGVSARAAASAPLLRLAEGERVAEDDGITMRPRLTPFDRFLTSADLSFADRLAKSFGRTAYLSPPLQQLLTENA